MENIFEKIEIIKKPTEDNISTSNPKAEPTCEKKITNIYVAKKKSVMYFDEPTKSIKKIKENYKLLVSPLVSEKYRLPFPNDLNIGDEVSIEYGVHVLKQGDTLGSIVAKPNCDSLDWKEIATINNIIKPSDLRIGKHMIFPLKKSEQVTLIKDIYYERSKEFVVSECVHLVTEVQGFKKGESVVSVIQEEGKITKNDELLTISQENKAKKELLCVVTLENDDISKGKAISKSFYLNPPIVDEIVNEYQTMNFTVNNKEDKPVKYEFFNESRDKIESKEIKSSEEKTWQDNFDEIKDKTVKFKVKSTSTALPDEEVESEEMKLEKLRSFQMFYDELSKQQLEEEDWSILASYEILDSEKKESLKKKYSLEKDEFDSLLESVANLITLSSVPNDTCADTAYYDNLESTSVCDRKYDVPSHDWEKIDSFEGLNFYRYVGAIRKRNSLEPGRLSLLSPNSSEYIDSFEGGVTTPDGRYDYSTTKGRIPNSSSYENDIFKTEFNINFTSFGDNNSSLGLVFTDKFIKKTNKKGELKFLDVNGTLGKIYMGCTGTLLETKKTTFTIFRGTCEASYNSPRIFNSKIDTKSKFEFAVGNLDMPHIGHSIKVEDTTNWDAKVEGGIGFHTYEGTLGYEMDAEIFEKPIKYKSMVTGTFGGYSISGNTKANADGDTLTVSYKWKYTGGVRGRGKSKELVFGIPEKIKKR